MMQIEKNELQSRRKFLKLAAAIGGAAVFAGGDAGPPEERKTNDDLHVLWRLNPAFRVNWISPDAIELYTHLGSGERLQHRFTGIDADLFMIIADEGILDTSIPGIANRHQLSADECRKRMRSSVREFERAKLIYAGKKMMVKIVETGNG